MKYRTTKLVEVSKGVYEAQTQDNNEVIFRGTLQECDIAATDFLLKQVNYDMSVIEKMAKEIFEKNNGNLNLKSNNNDPKNDTTGESSIG